MSNRTTSTLLFALAVLAGGFTSSHGQSTDRSIDPHELYETRCAGCHLPHAGAFVDASLEQIDGKAIGRRSRRELRSFLEAGHGKLEPDEITTMVTHLTNILQSGRVYHAKCRICHDRAVRFVRLNLQIEGDTLVGRYSGRDIAQFLKGHGRLAGDEVPKMVEVLKRQLTTAE